MKPGRFTPLTFLVVVFALASIALTLTIDRPRTDALHLFGVRVQKLLAAEIVGLVSLILLAIDFLRRPGLRGTGWTVLVLALVTALVLADIVRRLYLR